LGDKVYGSNPERKKTEKNALLIRKLQIGVFLQDSFKGYVIMSFDSTMDACR
jgi:hypothetical protein